VPDELWWLCILCRIRAAVHVCYLFVLLRYLLRSNRGKNCTGSTQLPSSPLAGAQQHRRRSWRSEERIVRPFIGSQRTLSRMGRLPSAQVLRSFGWNVNAWRQQAAAPQV
jgi:hypothetical protein